MNIITEISRKEMREDVSRAGNDQSLVKVKYTLFLETSASIGSLKEYNFLSSNFILQENMS